MTIRQVFILFAIAFAVQTAHYAEHVTQMIQIYALGITPPEARGLLGGLFDFEWVHFLYNVGLEVGLVGLWLEYRLVSRGKSANANPRAFGFLTVLALFQGYHSIEHIAKLYQYLFIPLYNYGLQPAPGILPTIIRSPVFLVHFWLNTIVFAMMGLALGFLRPNAVAQATPAENR